MTSKFNRKDVLKLVLMVMVFILALTILSDWEHFKDGLIGLN